MLIILRTPGVITVLQLFKNICHHRCVYSCIGFHLLKNYSEIAGLLGGSSAFIFIF